MQILSTTNAKMAKGGDLGGYRLAGLMLAPSRLSGRNVCPHSTAECRPENGGCLADYGKWAQARATAAARLRRTRLFHEARDLFGELLSDDLDRFADLCERHGVRPAVRLNVFSDLPYERIRFSFPEGRQTIIDRHADRVLFYDYTKHPYSKRPGSDAYRLTYSFSGHNADECRAALADGRTAAVVFDTPSGEALPSEHWGYPVLDGDTHDHRHLDPPGFVIGLRAKGRLRTAGPNAFVVPTR